jgi:hypothetical protein
VLALLKILVKIVVRSAVIVEPAPIVRPHDISDIPCRKLSSPDARWLDADDRA